VERHERDDVPIWAVRAAVVGAGDDPLDGLRQRRKLTARNQRLEVARRTSERDQFAMEAEDGRREGLKKQGSCGRGGLKLERLRQSAKEGESEKNKKQGQAAALSWLRATGARRPGH
jgi:hypothetical protein